MFGQDLFGGGLFGQVSNRPDSRSDGRRGDTRVTLVVREGTDVTIVVRDR